MNPANIPPHQRERFTRFRKRLLTDFETKPWGKLLRGDQIAKAKNPCGRSPEIDAAILQAIPSGAILERIFLGVVDDSSGDPLGAVTREGEGALYRAFVFAVRDFMKRFGEIANTLAWQQAELSVFNIWRLLRGDKWWQENAVWNPRSDLAERPVAALRKHLDSQPATKPLRQGRARVGHEREGERIARRFETLRRGNEALGRKRVPNPAAAAREQVAREFKTSPGAVKRACAPSRRRKG